MMDVTKPSEDDDSALAAEYALRLLPSSEVLPFETRLASEPDLRASVREWSERLGMMSDEYEAVAPPPRTKEAVLIRVFPSDSRSDRLSILRFLGGIGLGGAIGVLGLALLVMFWPPAFQPDPEAEYIAELSGEGTTVVVEVDFSLRRDAIVLTELRGAPSFGTVYELWLIVGDAAPVSLGLLPGTAGDSIPIDHALADSLAGATLAISEEPPGGSLEAGPSGPVRAAGTVSTL